MVSNIVNMYVQAKEKVVNIFEENFQNKFSKYMIFIQFLAEFHALTKIPGY